MRIPVGVGVGRSRSNRSQSGRSVGRSGVPEGRRSYGLASRFKNVRRNRSSWIAPGFTEGRVSKSVPLVEGLVGTCSGAEYRGGRSPEVGKDLSRR